jgi:hypothetical protein
VPPLAYAGGGDLATGEGQVAAESGYVGASFGLAPLGMLRTKELQSGTELLRLGLVALFVFCASGQCCHACPSRY